MLIMLSGPSGVGKNYLIDAIRSSGFSSPIPYTTRSPRENEKEGVHYHFRSRSEIVQISDNFANGFWANAIGDFVYGYIEDLPSLSLGAERWIVQAYADITLAVKKAAPDTVTIFVDYATSKCFEERIRQRSSIKTGNLYARQQHAAHERLRKTFFDHIFESDDPPTLLKMILEKIPISQRI